MIAPILSIFCTLTAVPVGSDIVAVLSSAAGAAQKYSSIE
jgi:hypothetical protein